MIGVGDARTFYGGWGLSAQVLAQIWAEANSEQKEALSKEDFFVSLRLVAMAQKGMKVSGEEARKEKGPLIPEAMKEKGPQTAGATQPWQVSQQQYNTFDKVFAESDKDKDGYITGQQARDLFVSYQIPIADLKVSRLLW